MVWQSLRLHRLIPNLFPLLSPRRPREPYSRRWDVTRFGIDTPFLRKTRSPVMRPHRHYVPDLGATESSGAHRTQSKVAGSSLPRPTMVTIAAARLARAWGAMQKETERGAASDFRMIELRNAALRLISVTGTKSLWSAIDAVGSGLSTPGDESTTVGNLQRRRSARPHRGLFRH
jgi:hypothetical protein